MNSGGNRRKRISINFINDTKSDNNYNNNNNIAFKEEKQLGKSLCEILSAIFCFSESVQNGVGYHFIMLTQHKHRRSWSASKFPSIIFYYIYTHILSFVCSSSFLLFFNLFSYVGKSACINGCRRHHNMRFVSYAIIRIFPLGNVIMSKFSVLLLLLLLPFVLVCFVFVLSC